jgi:hypothetical protein
MRPHDNHEDRGAQPRGRPRARFGVAPRCVGEAAARERGRKMLRAEKQAAVVSLTDADVGQLIATFDALLRGPADLSALAAELDAALRALSAAGAREEADGA